MSRLGLNTTMIKIVAPIKPVTFKRPGSDKSGRRFNPRDYAGFKDALGWYAKIAMRGQKISTAPLRLYAEVYNNLDPWTLNFGDWDNHGKSICDALNKIAYDDDRQIVEAHVYLRRGDPQLNIMLEEIFN